MRKLMSLMLIVLVLVFMFAGCNVNDRGNYGNTSPSLSQNQQTGGTGLPGSTQTSTQGGGTGGGPGGGAGGGMGPGIG